MNDAKPEPRPDPIPDPDTEQRLAMMSQMAKDDVARMRRYLEHRSSQRRETAARRLKK